jgi:hypothetical protein
VQHNNFFSCAATTIPSDVQNWTSLKKVRIDRGRQTNKQTQKTKTKTTLDQNKNNSTSFNFLTK